MIAADASEWTKIDGIGKVLAENIRQIIKGGKLPASSLRSPRSVAPSKSSASSFRARLSRDLFHEDS
jgi:hypothetical protein